MTWELFVELATGDVLRIGPLNMDHCTGLIRAFLPEVRAVCLPWQG